MLTFDQEAAEIRGTHGALGVQQDDEITRKLMMLIEGECEGLGAQAAAEKHGYSRQRYYQVRNRFRQGGAAALQSEKRGPKTAYRRTPEVTRQVVRHRFLDPDASAAVIAQKLRQCGLKISQRSVERVIEEYGLQKKLYRNHPDRPQPTIETQRTKERTRIEPSDPASLERNVRQLLADKVSGNLVGLWLLIPEHLRLGTYDLLCGWTGKPPECVEPRIALQLLHEAALCNHGQRRYRSLSQRGFELANGLPFIVSDPAVHNLLDAHTLAQSQALQVALGRIRRASGHFPGRLLALDPHRIVSYSQRQMRRRKGTQHDKATKVAQTFFCIDADSSQPVCFTLTTSGPSVSQASQPVLQMAEEILNPTPHQTLVMADTEHFATDFIAHLQRQTPFDLLAFAPRQPRLMKQVDAIPDHQFTPQWAGFATTKTPFHFARNETDPCLLFVQRSGEPPKHCDRRAFLCTIDRPEAEDLALHYPKRWHAEEFFNFDQAIGWDRARTLNLNIRYGLMTLALFAQAAVHQLRHRLTPPLETWNAKHLANDILQGLDGDLRVRHDTIIVTYYNAPDPAHMQDQFSGMPDKLRNENVDPRIPWLYNLKLDFHFR